MFANCSRQDPASEGRVRTDLWYKQYYSPRRLCGGVDEAVGRHCAMRLGCAAGGNRGGERLGRRLDGTYECITACFCH